MAWHNKNHAAPAESPQAPEKRPAEDCIRNFLETVQEQIRWKRARPVLALELARHLEDQRDALVQEGTPADEAARLAVADMGDPVEVGAELDRVHRPRPQWGLLGLTLALAVVCVVLRLVLTASWRFDGESPLRALLALLLGTGCMMGAYFLDISRLARHAVGGYVGALLLGAVCICLVRESAYRGVYYFSYYFSLFLPVAYALWVYACRGRGWPGLLLAVAGGLPLMFVCAWWYPSLANLMTLVLSGFGLMLCAAWGDWFGVRRGRGTAVVLGITALLGWVVWTLELRHMARLQIAIHPELDPEGGGWFMLRLREFLQGIPLLGSSAEGVSANIGSRFHFPSGIGVEEVLGRDFFPAILAVRWGWLPLMLLMGTMAALALWLAVKGLRQKHRLGRLTALAVSLALGVRMLLSMVLNTGLLTIGVGCPLLGGNSFLVADMTLIGLALSAFRGDSIAREETCPSGPRRRIKRIRLKIEYQ